MKYIVWRLIGFYGFVFLFGHILLYGNNRFAEKRIQEIEAQNYSYETYVTVTDKSTNHDKHRFFGRGNTLSGKPLF